MNITKLFRTPILKNIYERLLLKQLAILKNTSEKLLLTLLLNSKNVLTSCEQLSYYRFNVYIHGFFYKKFLYEKEPQKLKNLKKVLRKSPASNA